MTAHPPPPKGYATWLHYHAMGNVEAVRELRALMALARWVAKQSRWTYAESTDKALARCRKLGLVGRRRKA